MIGQIFGWPAAALGALTLLSAIVKSAKGSDDVAREQEAIAVLWFILAAALLR